MTRHLPQVGMTSLGWTVLLAACGSEGPAGPSFSVRDSAGIAIVENERGRWLAGDEWTLSTEPQVEIGVREGEGAYQLYRALDASVLSDRRIVVANAGTSEIRYYDTRGRHLLSVGGTGDGPGEFRRLQGVIRLGADSIITYDRDGARLTVFDSDGVLKRTFTLRHEGEVFATPEALAVFGDGSMLMRVVHPYVAGEAASGPHRDPIELFRYSSTGELTDTIGIFPGVEVYVESTADFMRVGVVPFARRTYVTSSSDAVFVGTSDRFEIRRYSRSGGLSQLIRYGALSKPITPRDFEAYVAIRLAEIDDPEQRRDTEAQLRSVPLPATMPAHAALVADSDGNLWVEQANSPTGQDVTSRWSVFGPDGVLLGGVEMPLNFAAYEIGADYVLGMWEDDFEVEYIRVYRIEKT